MPEKDQIRKEADTVADDKESESGQPYELTDEERREKRFKEWGDQFDIWLIRAAKKQRLIECILSSTLAGITKDGNIVEGIPLRVDKDQIQLLIDQQEVWISRNLMLTAKHVAKSNKARTVSRTENVEPSLA